MPTNDDRETTANRPGALPADATVEDVTFREVATPAAPADGQAPAAARAAPERRRIGLHHIAFFRTYLEGLDLADAADRYLDFGRDTPRARRTQRWLLDELVAAARKHKDFATARLLKIRPAAIAPLEAAPVTPGAQPKRQAPSLDDFAAERDPDGFYTEAELLELFTAEFPAGGESEDPAEAAVRRRQERNARLRAKQLVALAELERLLVEVPKPEHHVLGWFDVSIALKLADVGLNTLRGLVQAVNAAGYRWYRNVPRLGEKGAGRITAWLEANGQALGMPVAPTALARPPRWGQPVVLERAPSTSVAPLEYFVLPRALDGSLGTNRDLDSRNKTEAHDDKAAILWWLGKYAGNANTLARYRTEAERLLLWAVLQKGKALSSLSIADCNEYVNTFLPAPTPTSTWIGSKRARTRCGGRFARAWATRAATWPCRRSRACASRSRAPTTSTSTRLQRCAFRGRCAWPRMARQRSRRPSPAASIPNAVSPTTNGSSPCASCAACQRRRPPPSAFASS